MQMGKCLTWEAMGRQLEELGVIPLTPSMRTVGTRPPDRLPLAPGRGPEQRLGVLCRGDPQAPGRHSLVSHQPCRRRVWGPQLPSLAFLPPSPTPSLWPRALPSHLRELVSTTLSASEGSADGV